MVHGLGVGEERGRGPAPPPMADGCGNGVSLALVRAALAALGGTMCWVDNSSTPKTKKKMVAWGWVGGAAVIGWGLLAKGGPRDGQSIVAGLVTLESL